MASMADAMRDRLVQAGVRILERDGVHALSARKVAAESGSSTMAVYTHFGGMTGLIDAIANEAFGRFTAALTGIPATDDPVADFFVMGAAYRRFALENPQRYQMMFGTHTPSLNRYRADLTVTGSASARPEWAASFQALRTAVRRMIEAGRIRDEGEVAIAGQIWSVVHGAVMLEMAGFFGHEGHGMAQILRPLTVNILVALGDRPDRVERSLAAAQAALADV
ncbi:hypothetical protein MHAS_02686 [Mycolicibacterium hassiacum DSM 44199]|jgi:AcrR family transcriptional regulator|nr:hypothetical protein MHAS_02686 [Mycolicibacterium hassiacum DSM 44199]